MTQDHYMHIANEAETALQVQSDTKKRELLKNPTKLKKTKKKYLLTETEPLQLAF